MTDATVKVPPDGGYGWVIALAMALNSSIYIPLMHCFGLIYKDTLENMNLSGAQKALIINLHAAFGLIMGLLNGVLLKMYGYRKVAILGAILFFTGLTLTAHATTFEHHIIFFGLVASLGAGITKAANSLALNTYFKKKRNRAVSFATTLTGLGAVIMPQVITLLMNFYTSDGVMLIYAGFSANLFATALLLQPVKWHMKEEEVEPPSNEKLNGSNPPLLPEEKNTQDEKICDPPKKNVFDEKLNGSPPPQPLPEEKNIQDEEICDPPKKNVFANIVNIFDLELLKDPIFVNILTGLALAVFSELSFTVLTPFILKEFGLNTAQIATFISLWAVADIVFRFLAPAIGEYFKQPPRILFIMTLGMLIAVRFVLLTLRNYYMMLGVAVGLGIAKGVRKVYVGLIVPGHVSLEKLPSASGMEMMADGLCILCGGSILGVIRDLTGSYVMCIVIMNFVTMIPIITWSAESLFVSHLKKKKEAQQAKELEESIPLRTV